MAGHRQVGGQWQQQNADHHQDRNHQAYGQFGFCRSRRGGGCRCIHGQFLVLENPWSIGQGSTKDVDTRQVSGKPCGSGLARDTGALVFQSMRVVAIAGKPAPTGLCLPLLDLVVKSIAHPRYGHGLTINQPRLITECRRRHQ